MLKRYLSAATCVWLAASAAAFGQSYIFQLPGPTGSSNQILGLAYNNFASFVNTNNALSNAFQVVSTPSGTKFYIVGSSGIQSANAAFTAITAVSGIAGTVSKATVTSDGKYLLVITDQHFYVIDTGTNSVVAIDPGVSANGGLATDVAVSHDGKTAWVLAGSVSGASALTAVNLVTQPQSGATFPMTQTAYSVTLSPRGLLYVAFLQSMIEIDPATMSPTSAGQMSVPGQPGPPHFTPDGSFAYSVNLNVCPFTGCISSILRLNVGTHTFSGGVPADPTQQTPQLADVVVGGNGQVYAFSPADSTTKLWDVQSSPFALVPSALGPGLSLQLNKVVAAAISNERPSPLYLYLITGENGRPFVRINLGTGGIDQVATATGGSLLWFDPVPALSGAASFFRINPTQTVAAGAVSAPLIAQLVDSAGRPVFNQPVTFTTATSDLIINTPSQTTGADGFAQTTITATSVAHDSYQITATSGSASANFTVVIGTGNNTGGTSAQMTIYSGDGQLLSQSITASQPLTVMVTDSAGKPLEGIPVTFTTTQGTGFPLPDLNTNGISGSDGLAASRFFSGAVDTSVSFQATTIHADAGALGSVDFIEMTQNAFPSDPGQPGARILTPANGQLTIPLGGTLVSGVVAQTFAAHAPQAGAPIPNVGIRLANFDGTNSNVVSCVGSTRGDSNGVSRCNVQVLPAACQFAQSLPQVFDVRIVVGEALGYGMPVTITAGGAAVISPTSGNNQTGNPGNPLLLQARVTDGCGNPSSGVTVSWSVTQGTGSASVTPIQGTSAFDGIVSALVVFRSTPGPITIQASAGALASATFQLTNAIAVSGITLLRGGGQSAVINQAFPNPVVFVARDANNTPVPGLLINFSASSGASVIPASATTDSQGQAQTSVTAGPTAGTIVITATYSPPNQSTLSATATLSARLPGPQITNTSFTNAASGAVGMTPCGLVTVTGDGIAPNVTGTVTGQQIQQTGLLIAANSIAAPILSISNVNGVQTANFQAPCELTAGTATVVVTVSGTATTVSGVPVFAAQPGGFLVDPIKHYGWVVREVDNSLVTPTNPARRGDRLYMIVTGLGQVTPLAFTNLPGTGFQNVNATIGVQVGGRQVPVPSARYLGGFIGAYIVEFQIPLDATIALDQSLVIAAILNNGTLAFGNPMVIPGVISP